MHNHQIPCDQLQNDHGYQQEVDAFLGVGQPPQTARSGWGIKIRGATRRKDFRLPLSPIASGYNSMERYLGGKGKGRLSSNCKDLLSSSRPYIRWALLVFRPPNGASTPRVVVEIPCVNGWDRSGGVSSLSEPYKKHPLVSTASSPSTSHFLLLTSSRYGLVSRSTVDLLLRVERNHRTITASIRI